MKRNNNWFSITLVCIFQVLLNACLISSLLLTGYTVQAASSIGKSITILYSFSLSEKIFNLYTYLFLLYLLIGFALFSIFLQVINSYLQSYVIASLRYKFRSKITRHIVNNDYSKNCLNKKSWLSWYTNDTDIVSNKFYEEFFSAWGTITRVIFSLIAFGLLNWILLIIAFVLILISISFPIFFVKYTNKRISGISQANEIWVKNSSKLLDLYDTCLFWQKFTILNKKLIEESKKLRDTSTSIYYDIFKVYILGVVFITNFSIVIVLISSILIAFFTQYNNVYLIIASNGISLSLFNGLNSFGQAVTEIIGSSKISKKFSISKNNKRNIKEFSSLKVQINKILYENKLIEKNIDFNLENKSKMLITGSSGSGKSSLLKLIIGENLNYDGNIFINDINYKNINLNSIPNSVWFIDSQGYLFKNKSLKDNITLFDKNIDYDKLENAIKKAGISELSSRLNEEVNFESKNSYSEGQMQQIAFSRFFYHQSNNDFLIIDESLSNLDSIKKEYVEQNLLDDKNLSLIYVTHNINEKLLNKFNLKFDFTKED